MEPTTEKKVFRSLIKKYFSIDLLVEFEKLSMRHDIDNNAKSIVINSLLEQNKIPFSKLGCGTNRYGVSIDGYVCKFALDKLGKMDNRREFKYSPVLYPDVIKVYESIPNGLIAVSEYITVFDKDMYYQNQNRMRKILKRICDQYLVGDIGLSTNNYMNWGVRDDGSIASLDFAYIYSLSANSFVCKACNTDSFIQYDDDFNLLICPNCGKKYSFKQIRKTISNAAEEAEVGDIRDVGYVLHEQSEELEVDPQKSIFMNIDDEEDNEVTNDGEVDEEEEVSLDDLTVEDRFNLMEETNHGKA
mgnify:CR=1 FL=1